MVIEELFTRRIVIMGLTTDDPARRVGVFNPDFAANLPAVCAAEKIRWLAGKWKSINRVPPTSVSPAYTETGMATFTLCDPALKVTRMGPRRIVFSG
jgi:hypothetical protein